MPLRSVRLVAWMLLAFVPLVCVIWAATIVVPVAIETREAMGKVFVDKAERDHFDDVRPSPPALPTTANTAANTAVAALPTAFPTATATTAPPTATLEPGQPTPTPTEVVPTPTPYPEWDGDDPINILLLGVDRRPDEGDPGRSDTMVVVRVDPQNKRVDMLSIPRDLLVEIPGYSATKINAAYPFGSMDSDLDGGGPTLAAQTVEYNFGIRIDYFAEVDISGMEQVVNILDGILLDVPGIVKDEQYPTQTYGYTRIEFSPGWQWMDGSTAVRYSRTRHHDGDFARQERQRQVLLAIRDRALNGSIITRLPQLISEVGDAVRTDLSLGQVLSLARLGQEIDRAHIYAHDLGPYVEEQWIDGGYYLVGNWEGIRALAADLPSDPNAHSAMDNTPRPIEIQPGVPGAIPTTGADAADDPEATATPE